MKATFAPIAVLVLVLAAPPAHAYLDPGTGSMLFQAVIGALLASALFLRRFWTRVWQKVRRTPKPDESERGATR